MNSPFPSRDCGNRGGIGFSANRNAVELTPGRDEIRSLSKSQESYLIDSGDLLFGSALMSLPRRSLEIGHPTNS